MMYFKALVDGIDEMPAADPADPRRDRRRGRAELGWPATARADLPKSTPIAAARLKPNDSQRIQRALEVWRASGTPLSTLHLRVHREAPRDGRRADRARSRRRDAWLHERIARRFDAMLAVRLPRRGSPLARETRRCILDLPSMRCVGYRQAWEALDVADPPDMADIRERGIAATRQLAKRQITWLRSMGHRHVVEADAVGCRGAAGGAGRVVDRHARGTAPALTQASTSGSAPQTNSPLTADPVVGYRQRFASATQRIKLVDAVRPLFIIMLLAYLAGDARMKPAVRGSGTSTPAAAVHPRS